MVKTSYDWVTDAAKSLSPKDMRCVQRSRFYQPVGVSDPETKSTLTQTEKGEDMICSYMKV